MIRVQKFPPDHRGLWDQSPGTNIYCPWCNNEVTERFLFDVAFAVSRRVYWSFNGSRLAAVDMLPLHGAQGGVVQRTGFKFTFRWGEWSEFWIGACIMTEFSYSIIRSKYFTEGDSVICLILKVWLSRCGNLLVCSANFIAVWIWSVKLVAFSKKNYGWVCKNNSEFFRSKVD